MMKSNIIEMLMVFVITFCVVFFCANETFADEGYIKGMVLDTKGQPISGVLVTAIDVERAQFSTTTTTSGGTYIITDLASGTYRVGVSAGGFVDSYKSNISVAVEKVTPNIDFVMIKVGSISGKVTRSDGVTPVGGASISVACEVGFPEDTVTNADGSYVIKNLLPSNYSISVSASGFVTEALTNLILNEGEDIRNIDFVLANGGSISGRIIQQEGLVPIQDALVVAFSQNGGFGDAITSGDGTYTITGLAKGIYTIAIDKDGFLYAERKDISVTSGEVTTDIVLFLQRE